MGRTCSMALFIALLLVLIPAAAQAELQPKVLLISGLGEPDPDVAFEVWKDLLDQTAVIGKPNLKASSIAAFGNSVRDQIRDTYKKAGHKKIGVVAHSVSATMVLEAILKDQAIRQDMIDRLVLISPLISGIDGAAHDIPAVLTFTGMKTTLSSSLWKGSNYFNSLNSLMKNTADRIQKDPSLLEKYPKILIVTSKDDGLIAISTSNPVILPFVSGLKVRLGLRHGRFIAGKRPILDITGESDNVYKLATLFLEGSDDWQKIQRNVVSQDKGEVVFTVKGRYAYMKKNGEDKIIQLVQNTSSKRYFLEGLGAARYHVFVDAQDGGEIIMNPAGNVNSPAPLPGVKPPIAKYRANPPSGPIPLAVSFDGSLSSDPDGEVVDWDWVFGDGGKGSGAAVAHTYTKEGNFSCQLTVTDDSGLTDTTQSLIAVTGPNKPPIASFVVTPTTGDPNTTFVFNGTSSSDPDGTIVSYTWDFGDSKQATGSTASHQYSSSGTYLATLTVVDNKGSSDMESEQVKVSAPNQPPVAILSSSNPTENPLTVVVTLGATDPDGTVVSATLDFGDGTSGPAIPNRAYSYTYSKAGTFKIVGTATDNSGAKTTSNALYVLDVDGDGYANQYQGDIRGSDCNDNDKTVHPGAAESPGDHKDSNCNGLDDF